MRKRYAPLSWPRRDPRHYRFAMPNKILEYKLKPVEFVIFSYPCYRSAHGQGDKLTPEVVAEGVRLSMTTVKKYVTGLVDRGLITSELTFAPDVQLTGTENFFTLPNEIFLLKLSPSMFSIYAYLLLIEDRRTHTCHPSYNTIAAATGMSKNTAMKSIGVLLEAGLITAESSSYFDKRGMKWKGNNLYTILPIGNAVDDFYLRQFRRLELGKAERKAEARLSRRCEPCVAFSRAGRESGKCPSSAMKQPVQALWPMLGRCQNGTQRDPSRRQITRREEARRNERILGPKGRKPGLRSPRRGGAGESTGAFAAPARPQPPAVRTVSGTKADVFSEDRNCD